MYATSLFVRYENVHLWRPQIWKKMEIPDFFWGLWVWNCTERDRQCKTTHWTKNDDVKELSLKIMKSMNFSTAFLQVADKTDKCLVFFFFSNFILCNFFGLLCKARQSVANMCSIFANVITFSIGQKSTISSLLGSALEMLQETPEEAWLLFYLILFRDLKREKKVKNCQKYHDFYQTRDF